MSNMGMKRRDGETKEKSICLGTRNKIMGQADNLNTRTSRV